MVESSGQSPSANSAGSDDGSLPGSTPQDRRSATAPATSLSQRACRHEGVCAARVWEESTAGRAHRAVAPTRLRRGRVPLLRRSHGGHWGRGQTVSPRADNLTWEDLATSDGRSLVPQGRAQGESTRRPSSTAPTLVSCPSCFRSPRSSLVRHHPWQFLGLRHPVGHLGLGGQLAYQLLGFVYV